MAGGLGEAVAIMAVISFADECLKYGRILAKKLHSYRHATEEATSFAIIYDSVWVKTEAQIEFLKKIANALDQALKDTQERVLLELKHMLETADVMIDGLISPEDDQKKLDISERLDALKKMTSAKKLRHAMKKTRLEKVINDVERWQARYDPTWLLVIKISGSLIDEQLQAEATKSNRNNFIMAAKNIRDAVRADLDLPAQEQQSILLSSQQLTSPLYPIHYSNVSRSKLSVGGVETEVLVDRMTCDPRADLIRTTIGVQNLARVLTKVDPSTFGLLRCQGVIRETEPHTPANPTVTNTFKFLFSVPAEFQTPKTLRAVLVEANPNIPLDQRLGLAKQLTNSILFLHTAGFVHKNIRPETILIFNGDAQKLGTSFLMGFEESRPDGGQTFRRGNDSWAQNLYRHPSRQSFHPEEEYRMQHDVYSLGVCLLELGLWSSFVEYPVKGASITSNLIKVQEDPNPRKFAFAQKRLLAAFAVEHLPRRMGKRYTDVVLACLKCLDESDNPMMENADILDKDGIQIGLRYIEHILLGMQEIVM